MRKLLDGAVEMVKALGTLALFIGIALAVLVAATWPLWAALASIKFLFS